MRSMMMIAAITINVPYNVGTWMPPNVSFIVPMLISVSDSLSVVALSELFDWHIPGLLVDRS